MSKPASITEFQMLEQIGSGSYSTVYRAMRKATKEVFAIKCVEKASLSKSAVDNILTEISLLKKLKHRHIVEMRDFLWDDRYIYIVMEFCNGGSLHGYIRRKQKLCEMTCRVFLRQLALALKYMRENEVSHFDLKPQNLLLMRVSGEGMVLKVADFGFAQHLKLGQENTSVKGSPLYMAPEILLKHSYDPTADLWSIGVILYECLFGKAPYSSQTLQELLEKIRMNRRIEIPKNNQHISMECEDLLSRLLKRAPKDRITFEEFFKHPFLDLEHAPSEENLDKAIQLINEAIELDQRKEYDAAYHNYCKGLQFFVPIIQAETSPSKKQILRQRVQTYLNRAEEIKHSFRAPEEPQPSSSSSKPSLNKTASRVELIEQALRPSDLYQQLMTLASSSPDLKSALEIGRQAELYGLENKLDTALDSYKTVLGALMPLLAGEPRGSKRRELLHQQIVRWMEEAEHIKSIRSAQILEEMENSPAATSNCCLQ